MYFFTLGFPFAYAACPALTRTASEASRLIILPIWVKRKKIYVFFSRLQKFKILKSRRLESRFSQRPVQGTPPLIPALADRLHPNRKICVVLCVVTGASLPVSRGVAQGRSAWIAKPEIESNT